ncbi:hypothetical protein SPRA44_430022 [Serratia proteamaculans]|nr:hypothetical protein SPRA44_430022 [Serratia proteamaculans]
MKKTRYTEEQIVFALKQAETGTRIAAGILRRRATNSCRRWPRHATWPCWRIVSY